MNSLRLRKNSIWSVYRLNIALSTKNSANRLSNAPSMDLLLTSVILGSSTRPVPTPRLDQVVARVVLNESEIAVGLGRRCSGRPQHPTWRHRDDRFVRAAVPACSR